MKTDRAIDAKLDTGWGPRQLKGCPVDGHLILAKVRKQKGYSQDHVCLEGGFSRGTLSKIENGLTSPEVFTLARIAEVIGVPLKKLIEFE